MDVERGGRTGAAGGLCTAIYKNSRHDSIRNRAKSCKAKPFMYYVYHLRDVHVIGLCQTTAGVEKLLTDAEKGPKHNSCGQSDG